jgi:hypothetical protein
MFYCDKILDKNICIVIEHDSYNTNNTLNQYFVKTVGVLYEYTSTSGPCREFLSKDAILLYAPNSMLSMLNLLNIKILMVLNFDSIHQKIKDYSGSSFSISC